MRVCLNLLGLPSTRQGGAAIYSATLARTLAERDEVDPVVVCGPRVADELGALGSRCEIHQLSEWRPPAWRRVIQLAASLRDPRRFERASAAAAAVEDTALVHYPLSFMNGPLHESPSVVTAVDVQHLEFPQFFSRVDRALRVARWHRAWRQADRIIVFSEFIRRSLEDRLELPAERIDVVPVGCHPRFRGDAKHDLPATRPFFFYPASPLPAKNHRRLLEAFGDVIRERPDLELILTGPVGHDWSRVQRDVERLRLEANVRLLGHLSLEALVAHYQHAVALVLPSLYEGFGIPAVEAMAAGCPVLASRAASLPEIVDGAGLLFDPYDREAIAHALLVAADLSATERSKLVEKGRERAEGYTDGHMAELTLRTYARVSTSL